MDLFCTTGISDLVGCFMYMCMNINTCIIGTLKKEHINL